MSKAFTKDEGAADSPLVVRQRAPLPLGATNYVTPGGLRDLRAELEQLMREKSAITDKTDESARAAGLILSARITELEARIAGAVVVDAAAQPHDEVRFGATVTVLPSSASGLDESRRCYRIVGVDEADATRGFVAFTSPLARALLGKRVGELATLKTPRGEEELEVIAISYDPPS